MSVVVDDLPRDLSLADYDEAKQRFASVCVEHGIPQENVGYFGSVTAPGISDIDALAIGDRDALQRSIRAFDALLEQSPKLASMFWHRPVYVLEESRHLAGGLHTFDGLDDSLAHRVMEGTGGGRPEPSRVVLNAVWLTFLFPICSRMLRQERVSLRKLLLIYKNLEYSETYFSLDGSTNEPPHARPGGRLASSELRSAVLERWPGTDVVPMFAEQLTATVQAFDLFVERSEWSGAPLTGMRRLLGVAVRRGVIVARSRRSDARRAGRLSLIRTNELGFELAARYLQLDGGDDAIGQYVERSAVCRDMYRRAGLEYPFISPFGLRPAASRTLS